MRYRIALLLAAALFLAFYVLKPAAAEPAATQPDLTWSVNDGARSVSIRLKHTPCADPDVIKYLPGFVGPRLDLLTQFQTAVLDWFDGKTYAACWIEFQGQVLMVDSTGDRVQPLPKRLFTDPMM